MTQDLRYACRSLWKNRGFAAMAILSLAAGIGANTAIFSLVNGVLLRPLDYPAPDRLVAIALTTPQFKKAGPLPINIAHLLEWRKRVPAFESIGGYRNATFTLTGDGRPELLSGAVLSANFFDVLGVHPRLGRTLVDAEDRFGQHRVVVLSDSLWRRRFGADPSLPGRTIMLNGVPHLVAGILPPGFEFPKNSEATGGRRLSGEMEVFRPLGYDPDDTVPHVGDLNYSAVARLRDGVSIERARASLAAVQNALDAEAGGEWHMSPVIAPLQTTLAGDMRQSLLVLMAAVGAVLLVLCVNLANLSLARAAGRSREFAIRAALGAGRWRLARQSLAESAALALIGGALGAAVAAYGVKWLLASAPADLPRAADVGVDWRVLLFALAISLVTGLLFGLLPALRGSYATAVYETLKSSGRANSDGRSGARVRNLLVAFEVGLSAALLVTAGLFLASFMRLTTIDRGFDVERVLAVDVLLAQANYPNDAQRTQFFDRVLEQTKALPGVESAAISSYLPLLGESWTDIISTEHDPRTDIQLPTANLRFISPGLFRTLRMPFRAGRDFEPSESGRKVAIISEGLARKLWPDGKGLGRRVMDLKRPYDVVGVVADSRSTSLDKEPVDMLYIPIWDRPQGSSSILVRTAMDPKSIASAVRAAVWSVDGRVPAPKERTLAQLLSESLARRRFQMMLVLLFAAAALALAAFGTYGVLSYLVARRRPEIGIRMALGAGRGNVLRLVLRQGMMPVFIGLAAGCLAAVWIGQYVSSMLFQVSPRDPVAFGLAAAVLILASAGACWIPAHRATRVDPMEALRFE
jgi:putative ABC transport system permease protein